MRVSPTGDSSTRGVLPISSSSDGATVLGTALPDVDGGAELADQLVDAPELAAAVRADGRLAVRLDEVALAPAHSRQAEQRLAGVPAAVLDHPLAPLAVERLDRDLRQSGLGGRRLDRGRVEAAGRDRRRLDELLPLARLEEVG